MYLEGELAAFTRWMVCSFSSPGGGNQEEEGGGRGDVGGSH